MNRFHLKYKKMNKYKMIKKINKLKKIKYVCMNVTALIIIKTIKMKCQITVKLYRKKRIF